MQPNLLYAGLELKMQPSDLTKKDLSSLKIQVSSWRAITVVTSTIIKLAFF